MLAVRSQKFCASICSSVCHPNNRGPPTPPGQEDANHSCARMPFRSAIRRTLSSSFLRRCYRESRHSRARNSASTNQNCVQTEQLTDGVAQGSATLSAEQHEQVKSLMLTNITTYALVILRHCDAGPSPTTTHGFVTVPPENCMALHENRPGPKTGTTPAPTTHPTPKPHHAADASAALQEE